MEGGKKIGVTVGNAFLVFHIICWGGDELQPVLYAIPCDRSVSGTWQTTGSHRDVRLLLLERGAEAMLPAVAV